MNLKKTIAYIGIALFASALGLWVNLYFFKSTQPRSIEKIMAMTAQDLHGNKIGLAQFQGKAMLLNFWASWCTPCVAEMPELARLQTQFPQVKFIGLGVDTAQNIAAFQNKVPVNYPLYVVGAQGLELARSLGNSAGGLPYSVLVDDAGNVRARILGSISRTQEGADVQTNSMNHYQQLLQALHDLRKP